MATLPVDGFKGTPEEIERQWYEKVYRGRGDSMRQLTWRAVLMGSALGGVLSLTNLYIGLKAGWGFGVAITACILSYAIWTTLHRIGGEVGQPARERTRPLREETVPKLPCVLPPGRVASHGPIVGHRPS